MLRNNSRTVVIGFLILLIFVLLHQNSKYKVLLKSVNACDYIFNSSTGDFGPSDFCKSEQVFSVKLPSPRAYYQRSQKTSADDIIPKDTFDKMQKERSSLVNVQCGKVEMTGMEKPRQLLLMEDPELVFCPIFSTGSSLWLKILFEISPLPQDEKQEIMEKYQGSKFLERARIVAPPLRGIALTKYGKDLASRDSSALKILVVRHPFERLVSFFRDKLERVEDPELPIEEDSYYQKFGQRIVTTYRQRSYERFGMDYFNESNHYGAALPVAYNQRPSAELPTFWEFIQFILESENDLDPHWMPMLDLCSPCSFHYDYVIKFEDLVQETRTVLNVTSMTAMISPDFLDNIERKPDHKPGPYSSSEITTKYFDLLSSDDTRGLYKIYEWDFRLFNYVGLHA